MSVLALYSFSFAANNRNNNVYGLFTETYTGLDYNPNIATEGDDGGMWVGQATVTEDTINPYEGGKSLKMTTPVSTTDYNGWVIIHFGDASQVQTNMSAYAGGTLEFMARTTTETKIRVKVGWFTSNVESGYELSRSLNPDGQWHRVSIPLSSFTGINLSTIGMPAVFMSEAKSSSYARTIWIDDVVWRKASVGSLGVLLKNRSNNVIVDTITWTGANPGVTKWQAADQYLELNLDYFHDGWGIQIYTDNTNTTANPRYTGTGNPAGLVEKIGTRTNTTLPMCWRIVDVTTDTVHIRQGTTGYPDRLWSQELGSAFPCFLWMLDSGAAGRTVANTANKAYATVWDRRGIHYSEGEWGGAVSPNYIYIGADFSNALTPAEYTTNRMIIELFYD